MDKQMVTDRNKDSILGETDLNRETKNPTCVSTEQERHRKDGAEKK